MFFAKKKPHNSSVFCFQYSSELNQFNSTPGEWQLSLSSFSSLLLEYNQLRDSAAVAIIESPKQIRKFL